MQIPLCSWWRGGFSLCLRPAATFGSPQLAVSLSVSDLSHCRKTANAVQGTFVRFCILAMRCYLVSLMSDGGFVSSSDMYVFTNYTWNVVSFILFALKPCFVGQAALPHFLGQELGVGLGQVTGERVLGNISVLGDLQNSNVLIQCLQQS